MAIMNNNLKDLSKFLKVYIPQMAQKTGSNLITINMDLIRGGGYTLDDLNAVINELEDEYFLQNITTDGDGFEQQVTIKYPR